jgi:alpha-L-fucosidase 2
MKNMSAFFHLVAFAGATGCLLTGVARAADFDLVSHLDACNVTWDTPGPSSQQSMPIGNGDIGLNVWVEPSGDLAFYIGKTDSWDTQNNLPKIGGIHISMDPSPMSPGTPFVQVLKLHESEIDIQEGTGASEIDLRVWVDANHPVIRVEAKSSQPVSYKVTLDDWRKDDVTSQRIAPDQTNQIVWYHRNPGDGKTEPLLANITFGAVAKGPGLVSQGDTELDSSLPTTSQLISIVPLTATTDTPDAYLAQLGDLARQIDALDLETTRAAHQKWWDAFWHRSWIFASGPKEATDCTEGYVLQRYVTACAGRGAYPIKFNGSIFVVDDPTHLNEKKEVSPANADYRTWGGGYWYQNTRAMYWPRLQAGDFDEMLPLFKMYHDEMERNRPLIKAYYGHDGSYFAEQQPFWQKLKYVGREMPANWNDHYFTDILDMGMMMLDYYEYTGDTKFAREMAIPMITDGLTFFNEHFYLGPDGKLLLDNDNAIEMYWKATDPAPDIAGLHAILARMIALPDNLVDAQTRAGWVKMQSILPDLPRGMKNDQDVLLPYVGPQTMRARNSENPELYAIYPFRLYGLGLPDLDLAIRTFTARRIKQEGCWAQDPVQSAMLGLTDEAARHVHFNFTRTDPHLKFLAFWDHGHDYMPDEDNGGNGESGFQQMLLQSVGKKLLILPAWPKDWDVDFKLNAPFQTTVQVSYKGGSVVDLVVNPPERKADVIDMSTQPAWTPPAPTPVGEPGSASSIISPGDPIIALTQTAKGQPNVLADMTADTTNAQGPANAIDGSLNNKYFNRGQRIDSRDPRGDATGFVVTPSSDEPVTKVQVATANDMPGRDPLAITVEGSNDPNAAAAGGNGFTLLYDGPTGLEIDPGRNTWGPVLTFPNGTAYKTYRVLVTRTRDDSGDGVQYSEVRLGN